MFPGSAELSQNKSCFQRVLPSLCTVRKPGGQSYQANRKFQQFKIGAAVLKCCQTKSNESVANSLCAPYPPPVVAPIGPCLSSDSSGPGPLPGRRRCYRLGR